MEKQRKALDAMLHEKEFQARAKEIQDRIAEGRGIRQMLKMDFEIWDEYIESTRQGREFRIHVARRSSQPHPEIFIAVGDGVLEAIRIYEDRSLNAGLQFERVRLDTTKETLDECRRLCSDGLLKTFRKDFSEPGVIETVSGRRADYEGGK